MRLLILGLVFIVMSSQGCKSSQSHGNIDGTNGNTIKGTTETPAPQESVAKNRLGIPLSLPYAGDLEVYCNANCALAKAADDDPELENIIRKRGETVNKLIAWESKLKGKELEEYQKWAAVASDASWCH
jgi:hypothetical protein